MPGYTDEHIDGAWAALRVAASDEAVDDPAGGRRADPEAGAQLLPREPWLVADEPEDAEKDGKHRAALVGSL